VSTVQLESKTGTRTELAHRSGGGVDVTLHWVRERGADEALVCVTDRREGAYFEIPAETYRALDVYYHPFAYRDFSTIDREERRVRGGAP
jgi:hypothetical protein